MFKLVKKIFKNNICFESSLFYLSAKTSGYSDLKSVQKKLQRQGKLLVLPVQA